jgi:PAS domain S-box-containing protein
MFQLPKLSLSSVPFYISFLVITLLGGFIGFFWAINEYQAYQQSVVNIRDNYEQQYNERVREENDKIVDFIEYKRTQQYSRLEEQMRERVQSAYSVASHVNGLYKDIYSLEEQRNMVVELLRPIRWDSGLGYYFAGRVSTGVIDLFADKPWFEGGNLPDDEEEQLQSTITAITHLVKEKGGGILRYNWSKPEAGGNRYAKIAYVRYFQPFDWFIGSGTYLDEVQSRVQEDIIDRFQGITFGKSGEILIFRDDGVILCSKDTTLPGRTLQSLEFDQQFGFVGQLVSLLDSGVDSGFYEYTDPGNGSESTTDRLGFMKRYPEWGWVVATSISRVEMEKAIADETTTYTEISFKNTALFITLFIVAVIILLVISYIYSKTISHSINHFTSFFQQAAESLARVEKKQLRFRELEELGEFANRMSEDRQAKEKVIRRDERRLDTLLQLGFMESSSPREMYDFTLRRIVEITESRAGYFLTIENSKPQMQSQALREDSVSRSVELDKLQSKPRRYDVVLQKVIDNKGIVIQSDIKIPPAQTFFALDEEVQRRLDVPVLENDSVVAILGLCNKKTAYGEEDTRQVTLLLEGMWLHRNRVIDRKEMVRLRQLLKNITDSMPSMLIGIDHTFRIIGWNRSAVQKTGLEAVQAEGCLLGEVLPQAKEHEKQIQHVITSGMQHEIRRLPVIFNGETRYETLTIYPLIFGEEKGAVLRFDDVTERVALEEMMIQSEKMVSVGGLAAGIAHEINNPLASVKQNLQMVKKRLKADFLKNQSAAAEVGVRLEDINAYLEKRGIGHMLDIIDTDSARAVKLVHNMLAFSRKSALVFAPVDVCKLLDSALEFSLADYDLKNNYNFKQIVINKEYDTDLKAVVCEETNIQQVFLNIIRNATHAMAEKGENDEPPQLNLRVKADNDMARIEIADNGGGMDQSVTRKIFEPFFTTKPVGKGTGLGLSISYYIVVDQHKGALQVESSPGQGSTFIVSLPFTQGEGQYT